jgi:hypothetical protein
MKIEYQKENIQLKEAQEWIRENMGRKIQVNIHILLYFFAF